MNEKLKLAVEIGDGVSQILAEPLKDRAASEKLTGLARRVANLWPVMGLGELKRALEWVTEVEVS